MSTRNVLLKDNENNDVLPLSMKANIVDLNNASSIESGLMASSDKIKLDSIEANLSPTGEEVNLERLNLGDTQYKILQPTMFFKEIYQISTTLTNCVASASNKKYVKEDGSQTLVFTADSGYRFTSSSITVTGATAYWVVSTTTTLQDTGTLVLSNPTGAVTVAINGVSANLTALCFTANQANSTVELLAIGSTPNIANAAYSLDGQTWVSFTPQATEGTNTITLTNINDKVYFRADTTGDRTNTNYIRFVMTGSLAASGNVNSLYSHENFNDILTLEYNYCFFELFQYCRCLTTAPELPAESLSQYCYWEMFADCSNLTVAPDLWSKTMVSSCYGCMFYDCISLTHLPVLPAMTLADSCYFNMFFQCTSLTTICKLPATVLFDSCYASMFRYCTSLVSANIILPATVLTRACYSSMFEGCSSLVQAPIIKAITAAEDCCNGMFERCTSLVVPPSIELTTLAEDCCYQMFYYCSSLKYVPKLYSKNTKNACYREMFYGCSSLTVSDTMTGESPYEWKIPQDDVFTTAYYSSSSMFNYCKGTRSTDDFRSTTGQQTVYYTNRKPV